MARLLVCAQSYPYPADKGGRIRYAHLLEALRRVHDVRLVLVRRDVDAQRHPAPEAVDVRFSRARIVRNVVRDTVSTVPVQFGAFADRRAGDVIAGLAGDADLFIAFEPRAGLYHRFVPDGTPRVIDLPDSPVLAARAQWAGQRGVMRRARALENLAKVRSLERDLVRGFDVVCVAGPEDARWISGRYPGSDCRVVPTAVDPAPDPSPPPRESRVLFTGDLRFAPNGDAVRFLLKDVWPRVAAAAPDARLTVVGHEPEDSLRRLLDAAPCDAAFSVPDVTPYLRQARVVVAPMRIGSGIKVKVLTAMAAARPTVITPLANVGIDADPDREVLVAGDADGLARAILRVLRDDELARRVARSGYELVRRRFSSEAVTSVFLDAVSAALARPRGTRTAEIPPQK